MRGDSLDEKETYICARSDRHWVALLLRWSSWLVLVWRQPTSHVKELVTDVWIEASLPVFMNMAAMAACPLPTMQVKRVVNTVMAADCNLSSDRYG